MPCLGNITLRLPGLESSSYEVTSDATDHYNCVAWAMGEDDRWWSHESDEDYYWPDQAERGDGAPAYQAMFRLYGFEGCADGGSESGFEKIAIFADEGRFTHVARQLPSGRWTSKLGENCDIEHEIDSLTHPRSSFPQYSYGEVVAFMRRPRRADQPPT